MEKICPSCDRRSVAYNVDLGYERCVCCCWVQSEGSEVKKRNGKEPRPEQRLAVAESK